MYVVTFLLSRFQEEWATFKASMASTPRDVVDMHEDDNDFEFPSQEDELENYLESPRDSNVRTQKGVLPWWQSHATQYPNLIHMARKYLIIPASSVPSERLFSFAGDLFRARRNRLQDDIAEAILVLKYE